MGVTTLIKIRHISYLGGLNVSEAILEPHTDHYFNRWRERVANYQDKCPGRQFTVRTIKGQIQITRVK